MIRYATHDDIPAIEKIARQWDDGRYLGRLRRVSLQEAIPTRELFVAEIDGTVRGFVLWHARLDGWSVVKDLAVDRDYQSQGTGRALLYSVPTPITLKCAADNEIANRFYAGAGFTRVGTESGVKRSLIVWQMRILNIIVRGDNKDVPEIARRSGSAYGVQEHDKPFAWPFMLDVEFEEGKVDWQTYLPKVQQWKPVQAMCVDYQKPDRDSLLRQIADLRAAGVLRVLVCPKFHGALRDVPYDSDIVIAISLRTQGKLTKGNNKFSGWMPDFATLRGRKVHLLGGAPALQKATICRLQGEGVKVLSVDGNSQFGSAALGSVYSDGSWRRKDGEAADLLHTQLLSSINIQRELNAAAVYQQLPLL